MSQLNEKKQFKKLVDNAKAYYVSVHGCQAGNHHFIPVDQCEITYAFQYKNYQFQYNKHGFYIYDEDGAEYEDWKECEKLEFERKFYSWLALEKILSDKVKKTKENNESRTN